MVKITILGPHNSGKSYYAYSIRDQSKQELNSTIGVEFFKHCSTFGNRSIDVHYWHICGKVTYLPLADNIVSNSDIVLIFFNPLNNAIEDFYKWAQSFDSQNKPVYIIVNKPSNEPIPEEIFAFRKEKEWAIRVIDAEHPSECKQLENYLLHENISDVEIHKSTHKNTMIYLGLMIGFLSFLAIKQWKQKQA